MQAARGLTLSSSKNPTFFNSKKVFIEISDAIHGPNGWWRGRSFATSVSSEPDSPKSPKGLKEKMKQRRVMVEAFVNEYRALNAGKYPSPSYTRKQVGGSFYNIKKMIQELEYNSKQPPTDMKNKGPLVKNVPKGEYKFVPKGEYKFVPKVEEVSSSKISVGLSSCKPSLRVMDESDTVIINKLDEATSNDFVEKEGPPVSTHVEKPLFEEAVDSTKIAGDDSRSITTSSKQIVLENKEVLHTHTELPKNSVEETAKSEGLLDLNCPERKTMHEDGQKTLKSETLERDMSRMETKEDQLSTRSTLWGNLRSFADGLLKLWRNK